MRALFEILPILLAVLGTATSLERSWNAKRAADRVFFSLATICCVLLSLAQTSWFMTLLSGMKFDTPATEITWTVFNTLTAVTFIYASWTSKNR
jgi:hypothetical protein